MRHLLVLSLVLTGAVTANAPVIAQTDGRPGADVLAKSLQQRYQGINDFTADFSQSYRGGVLKTRTVEEGTVAVKKPGRMHWIYTKPEKKEFVSDGTRIYFYVPQDRQVMVSDAASADSSTSSLFLAGKGDIAHDFTASFADTPVSGTLALKLV